MYRLITSRLRSFRNAFSGVMFSFKHEPNFRIHLVFAILVVIAGFLFRVEKGDWLILILTIGVVLTAELMNTAVEKICDRFMQEQDPFVKIVKDSAAASVLIVSIAAAIIGLIIFLPYLFKFINGG